MMVNIAEIPLGAWAESERARVDRFVTWWRAEQTRQPDLYPARMPDDEWEDQYRDWADGDAFPWAK